jgi:hypothetical protein
MGRAESFCSSPNTVSGAAAKYIRVAILHEFARHSRDKAEDDFPCCRKVPERRYDAFIYTRENKRLVVELQYRSSISL